MTDYKLVPVEPTAEMVKAACDEEQRPLPMWTRMKAIYTAMLAAAPQPAEQQPAMEETMDTPDKIWLIDMGDCVAWADDPNPAGMDDDEKPDAVEYVRADTLARHWQAEAMLDDKQEEGGGDE